MEVKYSNFETDQNIYGKNEICGLYDITGNYIYNNFYDVKEAEYPENMNGKLFLKLHQITESKSIVQKLIEEFELDISILQKKLKTLSSSELIKILIIRVCASDAKVIFLDHIDTYLTPRDLEKILKALKNNRNIINKTIIYNTNNLRDMIAYSERYIIAENGASIYNGKDFKEIPVKSEIAEFTELANEKNAKLDNYKDINDLLKAIYRSVKK